MAKATWKNVTIAESDDTIMIEGNHYFPIESINMNYLKPNDHSTICHWKGEASYYDVVVDGETSQNGAFQYKSPLDGAIERVKKDFSNYISFWQGVEVTS